MFDLHGFTYQVLVDALVQLPLLGPALPELLVPVLKARPVPPELLQAVRVDVLEPVHLVSLSHGSFSPHSIAGVICLPCELSLHPSYTRKPRVEMGNRNVHAGRAPRHPPPLLQALDLAAAAGLRLALHVVIVVVAAPRADEEGGGEERGRGRADLLDRGDRVRERGGVDEDVLVETERAAALAGREEA